MKTTKEKNNPLIQAVLLVICLIVGSQTCMQSEEENAAPSMQSQQITSNP